MPIPKLSERREDSVSKINRDRLQNLIKNASGSKKARTEAVSPSGTSPDSPKNQKQQSK